MKNGLVVAVPVASGRFVDAVVVQATVVAFVVFCAASCAVYLLNDVRDLEADRRHPVKCRRPIAAGELSPQMAVLAAVLLAVAAVGGASAWSPALGFTIGAYLVVQLLYTLELKHQPVTELVLVASGFVLRVVAGGVASDLPQSVPFLVVVTFGSLFMVIGKRYSELATLGTGAGTRRSLRHYSTWWLTVAWSVAAAVTVGGYVLASQHFAPPGSLGAGLAWASVPPFAAGIVVYARHVHRGDAGSPETVVLGDRVLRVLGVLWLVPVALAVTLR